VENLFQLVLVWNYTYIRIYLYVFIYMNIHIYVYMYSCICMHVSRNKQCAWNVDICYGIFTKWTPSIQLFTTKRNTVFNWPWCVNVHTYWYVYTCLCICIYMCIYIFMYICICMYTYITRWAVCVKCRYVVGDLLRERLQISDALPNRTPFSIRHSV